MRRRLERSRIRIRAHRIGLLLAGLMLLGASGAAHEATAQIREGTQEGFRCSDASFHYRYFSVIRVPQGIEVTLEQDGLAQPIVKNERGA